MTRWARLLPLLAAGLGCSKLTETDGGAIAIEVQVPNPATLETGDTLRLSARALNADGDSIAAAITWRTPDTTITLDPVTGLVTGRFPGTARVQASVGTLSSGLVQLTVTARADTLILASDSAVAVPPDQPTSPPLTVRVETFAPPGPLAGWPVAFAVVSPTFADPAQRTVELPGGVLADTVTAGTDGTASVTVNRVAGTVTPDTVVVEVRATRTRGDPVPGSGQRFIVTFPTTTP